MVDTIQVGSRPYGITYNSANGNVYVANYGSDTVSVIATSTPIQPPSQTTINSATDGNGNPVQDGSSTVSTDITFHVTATPGTKPIAGFECSLDEEPFSTCANANPATINLDRAGYKHMTEGNTNTLLLAMVVAFGVMLVAGLLSIPVLEQSVQADKGGIPNTHASTKARGHCTLCWLQG